MTQCSVNISKTIVDSNYIQLESYMCDCYFFLRLTSFHEMPNVL